MNITQIENGSLHLSVALQNTVAIWASRGLDQLEQAKDERGEGVISAAIAVLIFALIGAAMWVAYSALFTSSSDRVTRTVNEIGNSVAP